MYYLGLDLGQRSDYTALGVLEQQIWVPSDHPIWTFGTPSRPSDLVSGWVSPADMPMDAWRAYAARRGPERPTLALKHLHRFPLGTSYPAIVTHVAELLSRPPLAGRSILLVDATGVGRPVIDMLDQAQLEPQAITITGGSTVVADGREIRVPKRDLAMAVQVLLQNRRLVFAAGLPLLDVLKKELQSFEVKINPATAHDSYLAWREGAHDDLVLSVAMAGWYREWSSPEGMEGFCFSYDQSRRPAPRRRLV